MYGVGAVTLHLLVIPSWYVSANLIAVALIPTAPGFTGVQISICPVSVLTRCSTVTPFHVWVCFITEITPGVF